MTKDQSYSKDLWHLVDLNKKLHREEKRIVLENNSAQRELTINNYTDEVLTKIETDLLLGIIQKDELLFYPIGSNEGASRTYLVARIDPYSKNKDVMQEILRFRQRQLPVEYDFETLSKMFCYVTNPDNRRPAKSTG